MTHESAIIRFGVFEADLAAGELRRNGLKVKLQDQPFQILLMLLERPGEIVTREELRTRLWPDGTFVDFDHSLNASMNKLRDALGDAASNARFIETVPRRGYRFIAPIERRQFAMAAAAQPESQPGRPKLRLLAAAVLIVIAAAAIGFWARRTPGGDVSSEVIPFTAEPGLEAQPSFSPDGNYLVYTRSVSFAKSDIYVKQIGSQTVRRVTADALRKSGVLRLGVGKSLALIGSAPAQSTPSRPCFTPPEHFRSTLMTYRSPSAMHREDRRRARLSGTDFSRQ